MRWKGLCFLFTLIAGFLQAEPPLISLNKLENSAAGYQNQRVKMRGFLYQDAEHRILLAAQPNLKSCCVGSSHKISQQVVIRGDVPSFLPQEVVEVDGILKFEPLQDSQGHLKQLYVLDEAKFLVPTASWKKAWLGVLLGVVFLLYLGYRQSFKSMNPSH